MACNNTGYTGQNYCDDNSIFGDPTGIIFANEDVSFSAADFLLYDSWLEKVKDLEVFPLHKMTGFEDTSTEMVWKDYDNGTRIKTRDRVYRFSAHFNFNECVSKQVLNFDGFEGGYFLIYGNVIRGYTDDAGVTMKPIRLSNTNIEVTLPTNGEPENTMLYLDSKSKKHLVDFKFGREMTWEVDDLIGITQVDLTVSAGATATSLVVSVASDCGGGSKPITGLDEASSWSIGSGTISDISETTKGVYTITGTDMAGDVNLKALSARTDNVMVESSGAVASEI